MGNKGSASLPRSLTLPSQQWGGGEGGGGGTRTHSDVANQHWSAQPRGLLLTQTRLKQNLKWCCSSSPVKEGEHKEDSCPLGKTERWNSTRAARYSYRFSFQKAIRQVKLKQPGCGARTQTLSVKTWMVRVTSVRSAPSSLLSGRFMWVDLQLEASLETAGINVIQWQRSSTQMKVFLCGGCMHTSPSWLSADLSGAQRVTAAPQPFCRESIADRAASDTVGWCHWYSLPSSLMPSSSSPLLSYPSRSLSLSLSCTHRSTPPPSCLLHMTWCRQDLQ